MANERARGLGYKYITDDKYLVNPFSPTEGISYEGDGSPVSYANSGIMSQAPIPAPLKYIPREGGGDGRVDPGPKDYGYTGPGSTGSVGGFNIDDIGEGTIDDEDLDKPGLTGWDAVKAAGAGAWGGPFAAGFSLSRAQARKEQKEIDEINEKINKQYGYNTQSNDGSGLNDGPDGGYTGSGNEGVSKSDPTHSDNYDMKNGGRAGYFFGGRVNYKAGGETAGPGDTGGEGGENPQDKSDTQFGGGGDSNNLVTGVDINKEINKKLTSMIPDRVDKNQLLFDNAKRYQTLSKNRNSPFFMNRSNGPKTINKNLYTNNLTDLNLQYPDIKIKNEYGMVDADKAKSLIDQAILEQTISPVEGFNLTRSIDTTGTQSNTSGDYTMGNFNFSSPNIEGGVLNSKANYNLGDLNLNANLNTNDSTINDSRLGFNYGDGALTGSTFRDNDYGYTTNKLGVDKTFNVGNNFKVGLDGSYQEDKFKDGSYYNADLTPSLTYNDGTFNARLSKEIVEGGTQPNLGIGFQKNGFYGNANNLLSQNPTGTIGYQKNIGSPDGPLQFSAGGEMDPFTGQKTAGLYGKYTFKNGGLASIL